MSDVTIEPHSLIMQPNCCEYCKGSCEHHVSVRRMFGLRTCKVHLPSGQRDVQAYMHDKRRIESLFPDIPRIEDSVEKIIRFTNF